MRVNYWHRSAIEVPEAEAEEMRQAWAAHRALQDNTAIGEVHGDTTARERAAALGSLGFGSGRQIERRGHLVSGVHVPGGTAPAPVYASQLGQDQDDARPGSPLLAWANGRDMVEWG
jgi:isocitrate dehydrogenase